VITLPMLLVDTAASARAPIDTFVIRRPTVIAFFVPGYPKDADNDEALGDFQLYASQSSKRMQAAGIVFLTTSSSKFRVQVGGNSRFFEAKKILCGYYLIAPGIEPKVQYGVMTDDDLMDLAARTFHLVRKGQAGP